MVRLPRVGAGLPAKRPCQGLARAGASRVGPLPQIFPQRILRLLVLGGLVVLLAACGAPESPDGREAEVSGLRVSEALGGDATEGFRRAEAPRAFEFPRDHGPHPGFRNEWWYLTGNLDGPDGARFGFHITFFRVGLAPALGGHAEWQASDWASPDLWMVHTAVVDPQADHHASQERFVRDGAGLAGATRPVGRVWAEDWELKGLDGETWELQFSVQDYALDLELTSRRAPVLQGEAGLSQKGPEPGNASYYYSVPRMAVDGRIRRGEDGTVPVSGQAWLDREWSTSALAEDQAGWDWFALQFEDGLDVMYYQLRRTDGEAHALSKGRWMPAEAEDVALEPEHIRLEPTRFATQPSGNRYPVEWSMRIQPPGGYASREFVVRAIRDNQEMDTVIRYWEGAVDILDPDGTVTGRGFVELTGYDRE